MQTLPFNTQDLIWQDFSKVHNIPRPVMEWLDDSQSLTAKLKEKFDDFTLNICSQKQTKPHTNENDVLGFNGQSMVREVALSGNGQMVVFARSIIPITDDTRDLLNIGTKPLGEILFDNADIKRGKLQITQTNSTWGRRSVFYIGTSKLLVSEFFLKPLYA